MEGELRGEPGRTPERELRAVAQIMTEDGFLNIGQISYEFYVFPGQFLENYKTYYNQLNSIHYRAKRSIWEVII